jgi:hypothetical protein
MIISERNREVFVKVVFTTALVLLIAATIYYNL